MTSTGHGPDRHWFQEWFNEQYLALYRHRDETDAKRQISLLTKTLQLTPAHRILDLGCGEGRHVRLLHQQGLSVSGIDLSETLIRVGREKYPELDLRVGDMRNIDGQWDTILSLFTSFGYFDEDAKNRAIVASIAGALTPGGTFWLDYLNPKRLLKKLVPRSVKKLADGTKVTLTRRIEGPMVVKDIHFQSETASHTYQERVYLYGKRELEEMMIDNGIRPQGAFGNYDGEPWTPDSPRTILYGRRNG